MMANGVKQLPEVPVLLCVLVYGRGIEHEVVWHGEQSWGVPSAVRGFHAFAADHAITLSLGAGDLGVVK
jgi:hypothetical protein